MEWRDSFLDLALIPLSLLLPMAYHAWLWREVRLRPLRTAVGINAATRRLWAIGMMKVRTYVRGALFFLWIFFWFLSWSIGCMMLLRCVCDC